MSTEPIDWSQYPYREIRRTTDELRTSITFRTEIRRVYVADLLGALCDLLPELRDPAETDDA